MNRIQEAYEALIDRLEAQVKEMGDESISDNKVIISLLDFILSHHGLAVTRTLAEEIESKGGRCIVECVEDMAHSRGLDLVEEA